MSKQPLWTRNFILICFSNFFQFMTFYVILSTMPAFVLGNLGYTEWEAGLAVSAFMASALLVRPLSGKWVDEYDRKKTLLLSLGSYFLVTLLFLGTNSLIPVIAVRFLQGLAFGVANTVTATLAAELVPESRRGEGIGYFATCMSLAVALGPFLGLSIIARTNFTVLFTATAILAFLAVVAGGAISLSPHKKENSHRKAAGDWRQYLEPRAALGGLPCLFIAFSFSGVVTFVALYAKLLGIGEWARYFYVFYACMVVLSRPFAGRLLDKYGPPIVVYPSVVLFALSLLLLSQANSAVVLLIVGAAVGLSFGALFSSLQAIAVGVVPEDRKGVATATFFFLGDFGMGLGPSVLGIIVAWTSFSSMYIVSSLIAVSTVLVYYGLDRRHGKTANNSVSLQ
ncbi:MAG: transporter [Firmicutes bacterium]|nr:transporter [Bacillota bacterium]